jgi:ATP synthase protein I
MAFRLGEEHGRTVRSMGALSAVGLAFVFAVLIGAAAGYVLDDWLGTKPWFFLGGFFLGLVAGMMNVFRTVSNVSKSE